MGLLRSKVEPNSMAALELPPQVLHHKQQFEEILIFLLTFGEAISNKKCLLYEQFNFSWK